LILQEKTYEHNYFKINNSVVCLFETYESKSTIEPLGYITKWNRNA